MTDKGVALWARSTTGIFTYLNSWREKKEREGISTFKSVLTFDIDYFASRGEEEQGQ